MRTPLIAGLAMALLAACGGSSGHSVDSGGLADGGGTPPDSGSTPDGGGQSSCGASNFDVPCSGGGFCPALSTCTPNNRCACPSDTAAITCGGESCDVVACNYPNWWCVPRTPGPCGPVNFTVPCPTPDGGTAYCATYSQCTATACHCPDPFLDVDCTGAPCNGGCVFPNWACEPRDAGPCGALNFSVQCQAADGGVFWCPTHANCLPNDRCSCAAPYHDTSCAGQLCDGGCTYPSWWCQ